MIRALSLAMLVLAVPAALDAQEGRACFAQAQTQREITECAGGELASAESALDSVEARFAAAAEDSAYRVLYRREHQAWVNFRDAACELEAEASREGSIYMTEYILCAADHTRRRTQELRQMLPGEGQDAPGDAGAVESATYALFEAMAEKDTAALRALIHPRALIASIGERGAGVRTVDEWIPSVAQNPQVLRERMWDPEIRVDGDLATLWAPYEFNLGDRFSHCGMDAFQFVRENGAWKMIAITFTRRTTGCQGRP